MHTAPDASPTLLCCELLPSLPATVSVNGPREVGALKHARSVALSPHTGVQLFVHWSDAPKPTMHTCWWRHWPPGGFSSAVVQLEAVLLVFHEIVVQPSGEHLPLTVPAPPKHTWPALHGKFGIVPYITVS